MVVSAHTRGMGLQAGPLNTAGVLRSIEHAYGVPYLGDAASPANGSLGSALVGRPPQGPAPAAAVQPARCSRRQRHGGGFVNPALARGRWP